MSEKNTNHVGGDMWVSRKTCN